MANFHLTPEGEPQLCSGACSQLPLLVEHFPTPDDATQAYREDLADLARNPLEPADFALESYSAQEGYYHPEY